VRSESLTRSFLLSHEGQLDVLKRKKIGNYICGECQEKMHRESEYSFALPVRKLCPNPWPYKPRCRALPIN